MIIINGDHYHIERGSEEGSEEGSEGESDGGREGEERERVTLTINTGSIFAIMIHGFTQKSS